ncbi:MAG: polysaccharide biosynthesis protein, partial [Ruminococcus sp.]|nr:polysaccharide biosynthesis protein [Ruminococcus sp.]
MSSKPVKICFAASSGGHFEQLMMLKPLMEKYDSFILTERTKYSSINAGNIYYVNQVNRKELTFIFLMIINTLKSLKIFFKEKPDVVICTGVLAM